MVIKRATNSICCPNDDGYDSIVKYLTIVPYSDEIITEGTFRVIAAGMTDSIDIYVDYSTCSNDPTEKCLTISNYDGLGSEVSSDIDALTYRKAWVSYFSEVLYRHGYVHYKQDRMVEIYVKEKIQGIEKEYLHFGRKLF